MALVFSCFLRLGDKLVGDKWSMLPYGKFRVTGVAQLVERRTRGSEVRTPSGVQEKIVSFSKSKMLC